MTIERYEIPILVGMTMLLVWNNTLPYDNVMFDSWDNKAKQPQISRYDIQNTPNISRISESANPYNIGFVGEEITKIVVYFAVPSLILYKMFTIVIMDMRFLRY